MTYWGGWKWFSPLESYILFKYFRGTSRWFFNRITHCCVRNKVKYNWNYLKERKLNNSMIWHSFISLHIRSMWETTVMHKQVSGWTVNFGPNFQDQSLLRNTPHPHFGKLQIWDDQSLLQITPPPPISENFRFGMTKVYSGIPPPPILENFRFGMTKVYSGLPLPPNKNCQRVQVRDFQNTESYYMWRIYPTRITTSLFCNGITFAEKVG